ncbi:MAG: hypothetical protein ABW133_23345 [Polyangiaceae bacterium]
MNAPEETLLEGVHSSMAIRRPAPGVIVLAINGADIGELGERPFRELGKDVESPGLLQLFVDARAASGPSIEVSGRWASWLGTHQTRFEQITMLPGSRFVQITAGFVRDFSGLGDRMRILTDPAAFDEALTRACTAARLVGA